MIFDLNTFLGAVANTMDAIETDIFGVPTNHSKRIAYLSVSLAEHLQLARHEIFDLASLAMLHDNGASLKILHDNLHGSIKQRVNTIESRKEHCLIGEDNLRDFPFLTKPRNIIKFHHEKWDGSGFFGLIHDKIPFFAQIIAISDMLDLNFDMRTPSSRAEVTAFVQSGSGTFFSPLLSEAFLEISKSDLFWQSLSDKHIDRSLKTIIPPVSHELNFDTIRIITKTFSRIIDAKSEFTQTHSSGLTEKLVTMFARYDFDKVLRNKLMIATDLHDLGKLVISNEILDKAGALTPDEYNEIKKHPLITRKCLEVIDGFEDIASWAANHHEKLNGSGYPLGLTAPDLDFPSRLVACLDIYQALREVRPYRKEMDHARAMEIMNKMATSGEIDTAIVNDIHLVFRDR